MYVAKLGRLVDKMNLKCIQKDSQNFYMKCQIFSETWCNIITTGSFCLTLIEVEV